MVREDLRIHQELKDGTLITSLWLAISCLWSYHPECTRSRLSLAISYSSFFPSEVVNEQMKSSTQAGFV